MMSLGQRIKELRVKGNLTQGDIAEKLNMGRSNFGHIENNRVIPSSKDLETIADILNTSTDYLLGRIDDSSQNGVRQLYIETDGSTRLLSVAETKAAYNASETASAVKVILDQINIIQNNDKLGLKAKKNAVDTLNLAVDLLRKHNGQNNEFKAIPIVGTICAGDGLLAQENVDDVVNYPLLNKHADFALRVQGDSMINAGIDDGDIVFFRKTDWFDYNGQIVAVITEDNEGSLKRIKWSEKSMKFQLLPENDNYSVKELAPTEFMICGVYAGHFKPERFS